MASTSHSSHTSRLSSEERDISNRRTSCDDNIHSIDDNKSHSRRHTPLRERSLPRMSPQHSEKPTTEAKPPSAMAERLVASGRYIPPALKRQLMAGLARKGNADEVRQREYWDQLKKRINGPVNKVNTGNISEIVVELFSANLVRGRGLFCRSVMRAQALSTSFTAVYAALVAVINTKLPIVGELLVTRLVLHLRRAFSRDDKERCISAAMFLAHLTNQRVAHEVLAFQIVSLLLETPTDDSVEVAVAFMREVGAFLADIAPRVLNAVFDTFRSILHEAEIDKRVQYMIEVLFQYRRDGFKDSPTIPDGLDLVDEDDQIIHEVAIDDDDLEAQDELNVFKFDEDFEENEHKYESIRRGILGEDNSSEDSGGVSDAESSDGESSGSESGTEGDSESEHHSDREESGATPSTTKQTEPQKIHDLTETELINLRRTIYLSIMSSMSFEEAAHKLLKIEIRPGEEQEMCNMVIECCSQERTYKTFFGLIGERLCRVNRLWAGGFAQAFASCYENIHRYETNHLRNIAHFFSHLLGSDALSWTVLRIIVLTEEATTSSSRIFLKILLQDLAENLGLKVLNERLKSPDTKVAEAVGGLFPNSDPKSVRFAINYYTSIGLGAITDEMREWLKNAPSLTADSEESDLESGSSSGSSRSSYSSSESDSSTGSESRSQSSYSSYSSSTSASDSDVSRSPSPRSRSDSHERGRRRRRSRSRSIGSRSRERKKREVRSSHSPERKFTVSSVPSNSTTDTAADVTGTNLERISTDFKSPKRGSSVLPRDSRLETDNRHVDRGEPTELKSRVRSPSYSPASRSPESAFKSNRGQSPIHSQRHSPRPAYVTSDPSRNIKKMHDLSIDEREKADHASRSRYDVRQSSRSYRPRSRTPSPGLRSSRTRDYRSHKDDRYRSERSHHRYSSRYRVNSRSPSPPPLSRRSRSPRKERRIRN
ncbi:MIF4G-domain-containing protein [Coemansia reversa NRRL 1564]|uniref:MIF4G-domain-containing protein n=1 Tax=Coemansia reversa (strain ATCC 12441 / NRRL 1564) TaxID=763665 RepID=A0A2G5B2Z7_COERN|nr:MIF4G-domain-containing protein [Coemansia reversa NRRL 1564]|eukprot:PIA13392.1 MIF4G-domain-containing protein [Coemansia reversa NRRL 1564]